MTPDLDIYEDESIEDRILAELGYPHYKLEPLTSRQLAHNILGKGYSGHNIQKALMRLKADGKIRQRGRRWELDI